MNGKHVTYYPEALMISHNPHAVVFYQDTKLFNLFVTLRTPQMGKEFVVNNTCSQEDSKFLSDLLVQLQAVQRSMQRLLSSHGYTSLIECDSYLRRYYHYATGLTATMSCPYAYKKSLQLCKLWALQHCTGISPHERTWLLGSRRTKRSTPWACTAGLLNIPRFFYTTFGGSCDSGDITGLQDVLTASVASVDTVHSMVKTIHGKTVYLAKITDKLVTKVNNLQSALRHVDKTFNNWQIKLQKFSTHENCHFNNFMDFLSKFSLEVTRAFSNSLRFTEINDILYQANKLHKQQLVGLKDLPSFLASELQFRLRKISSLAATAQALDAGFPLLLNPMVDFSYEPSKMVGANMLFTLPDLVPNSPFCTIEYLVPLKYKLKTHCYQGPIASDELALLRCSQSEYILHKDLLDKCYRSDDTLVCPQHILNVVNDTNWLGLPWHTNSKLVFSRRHTLAADCSNLHDLLNLGGRYYLATQQRTLALHNSTNRSTNTLLTTPLTVYHFPCEISFSSQTTGFGNCPKQITLHLPLFTSNSFHYVPWLGDQDNHILNLHYKSLNFTPPLEFDNSTLQSLDKTFHLLDEKYVNQVQSLRQSISQLHFVHTTSLNDVLTYLAFVLAILNTVIIFLYHCRNFRSKPRQVVKKFTLRRAKRSISNLKTPPADSLALSDRGLDSASDHENADLPQTSATELDTSNSSCSKCSKPLSVRHH